MLNLFSQVWALPPWHLEQLTKLAEGENFQIDAVRQIAGRKLDGSSGRDVTTRDGVAIIPVRNLIVPRESFLTEIGFATSVESLALDFTLALENDAIKGILLEVDSPGGAITGLNEFAEMVFMARGKKPIVAYVGGYGASGAYWIASAADRVSVDATASLGSIGVVISVQRSRSGDLAFVSAQSPKKRPDPETEGGRGEYQKVVDALGAVFVEKVARNRGVTPATVMTKYGEGSILVGKNAVKAGLADRLGSFEKELARLSGKPYRFAKASVVAAAKRVSGTKNASAEVNRRAWEHLAAEVKPAAATKISAATLSGVAVSAAPVVGAIPDSARITTWAPGERPAAAAQPQNLSIGVSSSPSSRSTARASTSGLSCGADAETGSVFARPTEANIEQRAKLSLSLRNVRASDYQRELDQAIARARSATPRAMPKGLDNEDLHAHVQAYAWKYQLDFRTALDECFSRDEVARRIAK